MDIQDPPNAQLVYTWTGVTNSHNIFQSDGYLYVVGADGDDLHILDLSNPARLVKVGGWTREYLHDVYVRGDYAYSCGVYPMIPDTSIYIIDVSDKTNPTTVTGWTYSGKAHSCWLTEDGNFLITADEMTGGHIKIWDVSDFSNINEVSFWKADDGELESVHNVFVRGDYTYTSHYVLGLQVIDISDPYNPVTAGYYDIYPGSFGLYEGTWGAYLFSESCYTYVSDISNGLFVVNFSECAGETSGTKGDINGDSVLDILDVVKIVNFMLGIPPAPTEEQAWSADLNNDAIIDVFDIVLLVDIILGQGGRMDQSKFTFTNSK